MSSNPQFHNLRPLLITLAVLFMIGILGGFFIIRTQQRAMTRQYYNFGITITQNIKDTLEYFMMMNDAELVQDSLIDLSDTTGIKEVQIISRNMRVFAATDDMLIGSVIVDPEIASVISSGEVSIHAGEGDSSDILGILVPLANKPECQECHDPSVKMLGVIETHIDTTSLNDDLLNQSLVLAMIGGVTLLTVGLSVALIFRHTVVRPFSSRINELMTERDEIDKLYATDRLASVGELAAGIAHELNNPLTSVIGFSELVLEKDLPDEIRGDLKIVNSEAQRASRIVRSLLAFSRKHPLEKQLVNVHKLIETVLDMRAYEQKVNNISVTTKFASTLSEVAGDAFQLQQVFLNIIINAEYFMTEAHHRGTLTINTEEGDGIIRIIFADDGPGISEENMKKLFDPFFTTKEVGKGTGLGLSIVYGIVTEHGGSITAESELGKGATFIIELPTAQS